MRAMDSKINRRVMLQAAPEGQEGDRQTYARLGNGPGLPLIFGCCTPEINRTPRSTHSGINRESRFGG